MSCSQQRNTIGRQQQRATHGRALEQTVNPRRLKAIGGGSLLLDPFEYTPKCKGPSSSAGVAYIRNLQALKDCSIPTVKPL